MARKTHPYSQDLSFHSSAFCGYCSVFSSIFLGDSPYLNGIGVSPSSFLSLGWGLAQKVSGRGWREGIPHSAVVQTFFPAPLKPYFLIVLRSQPTVGPSSIFLLVSTRNEGDSGCGASLFASRNAANSS